MRALPDYLGFSRREMVVRGSEIVILDWRGDKTWECPPAAVLIKAEGTEVAWGSTMTQDMIGAVILPQPGKAADAAKALQKLGFKVLHVRSTFVSVPGPESLWREQFPVTFLSRSKPRHSPSSGWHVFVSRVPLQLTSFPISVRDLANLILVSWAFRPSPSEFFLI